MPEYTGPSLANYLLVLGFLGEYTSSIHNQIKKQIEVNEKEKINF